MQTLIECHAVLRGSHTEANSPPPPKKRKGKSKIGGEINEKTVIEGRDLVVIAAVIVIADV